MGEEQRFGQVYDACHERVYRYAVRRVAPDAVEDIVAEVFLVAWRRRREIPEEPLPWLYGVARRTVANHRRGRRRGENLVSELRQQAEVGYEDPSVVEALQVAWAWSQLAEADQELLRLVAWEGLMTREIAPVLGCSAATASVRLYRTRRRFQRLLDDAESGLGDTAQPCRPYEATREV